MGREITAEEKQLAQSALDAARAAMRVIEDYSQQQLDDLARAVAWATANEATFVMLTEMAVAESKMGNADGAVTRRFKIMGILRDALRQKSVGVIDEIAEKGIVKYGKPVGVIAGLLPVTNPVVTMVGMAINAVKCRDALIFSPHPASVKTALETSRILRAALRAAGAPEDLVQCFARPSIPLAQELMSICDLTIATGGPAMVKSAYSSGKPAYGVGAGNATVVVDESANVEEAARNTRISKIHNNGSGCSCDGNLVIEETLYDRMIAQLQKEGGYLCNDEEKSRLRAVMWDSDNHRLIDTVARRASEIAAKAGLDIGDATFIFVEQDEIGKAHPFSGEKLSPVLAVFKYKSGFENALQMVAKIFEVGGKGHSCGIASYNDDHIEQLALMAPVSRIMVRQPNVHGNAGSFTNGMPMTPSLGCGTWGGNIISENVTTKHYLNTTWVSRTIAEDKPSEAEIFGRFYNSPTFL
ncbi:MAG: aldehyde dehydrogenase family protein [Gammaproteobacteria bacterium]|nr:aldehyde dehydrogenase family protein [Gammaproteobacteria bacterium]MDH5321002.1 aldehyde dehydrogenase family protein [Gammaproteobacteria bacterium]